MTDGKKEHEDVGPGDGVEENTVDAEETTVEAASDDPGDAPEAEATGAEVESGSDETRHHDEIDEHDAQYDEHHYDEHHDEHPEDEESEGRSFAAKALIALVLLLVGGAAALIGGPKLAPMLPAGVAQYLTPGASADIEELEVRIAALEAATSANAERSAAEVAAAVEQGAAMDAELAARIEVGEAVLASLEGADVAALSARIDSAEATLAGLREELSALSSRPGVEGGTLSDAAVSGLRAELATLNQKAEALIEGRVAPLEKDVADLEARLAAAEGAVSAGAATGKGAASAAAFATLSTAVNSASPYQTELDSFTAISGASAPEALAASAATGAPSLTSLRATFSKAASEAISAATLASAGEGYADKALAWLESRVTVMPVEEQEGPTPAAVLSRAEARLDEGALRAALAELDALPTVSKEAMSDWIGRAEARAAVDAALAELAAAMLPGASASN